MQRYDWVVDNLKTHMELAVLPLVAQWCDIRTSPRRSPRHAAPGVLSDPTIRHVHFTPSMGHANQVEFG